MKLKTTLFVTVIWLMVALYGFVRVEFLGISYSMGNTEIMGWSVYVFSSYCIAIAWDILRS